MDRQRGRDDPATLSGSFQLGVGDLFEDRFEPSLGRGFVLHWRLDDCILWDGQSLDSFGDGCIAGLSETIVNTTAQLISRPNDAGEQRGSKETSETG